MNLIEVDFDELPSAVICAFIKLNIYNNGPWTEERVNSNSILKKIFTRLDDHKIKYTLLDTYPGMWKVLPERCRTDKSYIELPAAIMAGIFTEYNDLLPLFLKHGTYVNSILPDNLKSRENDLLLLERQDAIMETSVSYSMEEVIEFLKYENFSVLCFFPFDFTKPEELDILHKLLNFKIRPSMLLLEVKCEILRPFHKLIAKNIVFEYNEEIIFRHIEPILDSDDLLTMCEHSAETLYLITDKSKITNEMIIAASRVDDEAINYIEKPIDKRVIAQLIREDTVDYNFIDAKLLRNIEFMSQFYRFRYTDNTIQPHNAVGYRMQNSSFNDVVIRTQL